MKKQHNISDILPKHLIWDLDVAALDLEKDLDIIIPRALLATTPDTFLNDIKMLEQFYTADQIITELKTTKERLSNNVCILVAEKYQIPVFARFSV